MEAAVVGDEAEGEDEEEVVGQQVVGPTKDQRKAGRRSKQLEAMSVKANAEDTFFRSCQREAMNSAKQRGTKGPGDAARETELFGQQGSHGINFQKYNEIQVEVKYPSNTNNNSEPTKALDGFDELVLLPQLKRNVKLMNYTHPTPIQRNAIPLSMAGHDLMCCAQTGSGKTFSFLLPVLASITDPAFTSDPMKIDNDQSNVRNQPQPAKPVCVVLAPTRELAMQIEVEAQKLTHMIPSVTPVCVYGGANARAQLRDLAFGSSRSNDSLLVVATPGRLTDFVDRSI
eukprot:scaffold49156_cov42-Attheya_sp.AAC.1